MRKLLVLVSIVVIACSLTALAKATYDFEDGVNPFIGNADPNNWCPISVMEISSNQSWEGDSSLMIVLDDPGETGKMKWAFAADNDPLTENLELGVDTVFFWLFLPEGYDEDMDKVQPFVQDASWAWSGNYQDWNGLPKDEWHCNWCAIPSSGLTLPLRRAGVEFTSFVAEPACTVYVDLVSSVSREGGAGIELITDPGKVILEASINTIKFSLDEPTPVLLSVYNLVGAKVAEIAPGAMSAGPHEMVIDAPAGMYIVKLVAGKITKKSKLIIL
jgi:hypothetical protein